MNAADIKRLRHEAASPFWWTSFWKFRHYTLDLCYQLENARKALESEPLPLPRDLLVEIETLKADKAKARSGMMMLFQFIHTHNRLDRMKPQSQIKPLALLILGLLIPSASWAQSGFHRNPWTTNPLPQVSAGANVTITTNAGHKLVVSASGGGGGDFYWTNTGSLLRTVGDGTYDNFVVDTNVASLRIGSLMWIDPTNNTAFYGAGAGSNNVLTITDSVGFGSDALGNNSGAADDALAFGEGAFRDNSGVIDQSSAIGQAAGVANSGTFDNSTLIGSSAGANNQGVKLGVIGIGHQILASASTVSGTNWAMVGSLQAMAAGGVNLGSFGFNNTFANVGHVSNRWIIGAGVTNRLANSMVFGQGITNYQFGLLSINVNASNPSLIGLTSVTNSTAITNQSPHAWTSFTPVASGVNDNRRSILTFDVIWGDPAASQITVCVTNGASIRTNTWGWDGVSVQVTNTVWVRIGPTNGFGFQTNGPASVANATMGPE